MTSHKQTSFATACTPASHNTDPTIAHAVEFFLSSFSQHHNRVTRAIPRAMADIIERDEATVVPARGPRRSRLPGPLKVTILLVLNLGINSLLWQAASNFLPPELGYVSKVPSEDDKFALTGPLARLAMKVATLYATWAAGYDCEPLQSVWSQHS
jgi:hypothetical protein